VPVRRVSPCFRSAVYLFFDHTGDIGIDVDAFDSGSSSPRRRSSSVIRSRIGRHVPATTRSTLAAAAIDLFCEPLGSPEGQRYLSAMERRRTSAFANRQVMTHWTRESLIRALGVSVADAGIEASMMSATTIRSSRRSSWTARRTVSASIGKAPPVPTRPGTPGTPVAYRDVAGTHLRWVRFRVPRTRSQVGFRMPD